MAKSEQQLADQLDLFLSIRLNEGPFPVAVEYPQAEAVFAVILLKLIETITPHPAFLAALATQLERYAGG